MREREGYGSGSATVDEAEARDRPQFADPSGQNTNAPSLELADVEYLDMEDAIDLRRLWLQTQESERNLQAASTERQPSPNELALFDLKNMTQRPQSENLGYDVAEEMPTRSSIKATRKWIEDMREIQFPNGPASEMINARDEQIAWWKGLKGWPESASN